MLTVPLNPLSEERLMVLVAEPRRRNRERSGAGTDSNRCPGATRATVCVEPAALSEMVKVPLAEPAAVGINVTEIVQEAPPATLLPQVFDCRNPVLAVMDVMASAACPESVRVMLCEALVLPTACAANVRLVAERVATGPAGAVPARLVVVDTLAA